MSFAAEAERDWTPAPPARRTDWIGLAEILFAGFAILFMTGGLTRLLTGGLPEDVARQVASPGVQLAGMAVYALTGVFLGLRFGRFLPHLLASALLLAPVLLALASTAWSVDPDQTLRRAISLLGTTAVGMYLGLRFDVGRLATLLFVCLSLIVGASFLVAVGVPRFGVHQAGDALTAHHAGLWRGLFWHKNALGPVASILALVILALWRRIDAAAVVKFGMLAVAAVVVLRTGSAQALVQLVLLTALVLGHRLFARLPARVRVTLVAVALPAGAVAVAFFGPIQAAVLELIGRDPTLSSRIYIWHAAILGGLRHPVLGNGYEVGWRGEADTYAQQLYYIDVGHAHNGYLQLWLDLGFVGVGLMAAVWIALLRRVIRLADREYYFYIFCLYFMVYYFMSNYVTTFLLQYQSVYWLLISMIFVAAVRPAAQAPEANRVAPPRPGAPPP